MIALNFAAVENEQVFVYHTKLIKRIHNRERKDDDMYQ